MGNLKEAIEQVKTKWKLNDVFRGYLHGRERMDADRSEIDWYEKEIQEKTEAIKVFIEPVLDNYGVQQNASGVIEKRETSPVERKVPIELLDFRFSSSTFTFVLRGTKDPSKKAPESKSEYTTVPSALANMYPGGEGQSG